MHSDTLLLVKNLSTEFLEELLATQLFKSDFDFEVILKLYFIGFAISRVIC